MGQRRDFLRAGATIATLGIAGCLGDLGGGNDTTELVWGGGAEGSATYGSSQAISALTFDESETLNISVQPSGGSAANVRLIDQGEVDGGIVTNSILFDAYNNAGNFEDESIDTLALTGFSAGWFDSYYMAVEGSGVEYYEDLVGKNVWPYWSGAAFQAISKNIFTNYLDLWDKMNVVSIGPEEMVGAVSEGRIDAFGVWSNRGSDKTFINSELDARRNLEFYPIKMKDENKAKILDISVPDVHVGPVYAWNRPWNGQEVVRYRVNQSTAFHPDVDSEPVRQLTALAHEHGKRLHDDTSGLPDLSKAEFLVGSTIPELKVHPGAAEYFKEIDAWNDEWQVG